MTKSRAGSNEKLRKRWRRLGINDAKKANNKPGVTQWLGNADK
jgi:hypothetical protein